MKATGYLSRVMLPVTKSSGLSAVIGNRGNGAERRIIL